MKKLIPLATHLPYYLNHEKELVDLFILLYQKHLMNEALDINVYGMPHLGSQALLQKYLVAEDVSNFAMDGLLEDEARYLTQAWRFNNGKRGTHFLNTFLKCVWGNDFEIHQLWQHKDEEYPHGLVTRAEIDEMGDDVGNYFLTSRLRIALIGASSRRFLPEIAQSLDKMLPARLFVWQIGSSIRSRQQINLNASAQTFSTFSGRAERADLEPLSILSGIQTNIAAQTYSVFNGIAKESTNV